MANSNIQQSLLDLQESLGAINNWAELLKKNQTAAADVLEKVNPVLTELQKLIQNLDKGLKDLLKSTKEQNDNLQSEIRALLAQYQALAATTGKLVEYLRSVNFPARLDKMDSTIATILKSSTDISDKLDRIRDKIETRIQDTQDSLEKKISELNQSISELNLSVSNLKKLQNRFFITVLILGFLIMCGILYVFVRII